MRSFLLADTAEPQQVVSFRGGEREIFNSDAVRHDSEKVGQVGKTRCLRVGDTVEVQARRQIPKLIFAIKRSWKMQCRQHRNRAFSGMAEETAALVVDQVELVWMLSQIIQNSGAVLAFALAISIGAIGRWAGREQLP